MWGKKKKTIAIKKSKSKKKTVASKTPTQLVVDKNPKKNPKRIDKIFGNNYNTGNIDVENLPDIKIESDFASNQLGDCYNAEEYTEKKALMEAVYDTFKASQWGNLPLNKKFSKELMPYIFNDIYKGVDGRGYSVIDIFISIAEFMDISYERVYEIAGLRMKEKVIMELESKYKVLSKKNINRLF